MWWYLLGCLLCFIAGIVLTLLYAKRIDQVKEHISAEVRGTEERLTTLMMSVKMAAETEIRKAAGVATKEVTKL